MEYREHDVPAELRRHVACVWQLADGDPAGDIQTIYPDGCCELIVHLGARPRAWDEKSGWHTQAASLFAGQRVGALRLRATRALNCVGVRLHPEASGALGAKGLRLARDRVVSLAALDAPLSRALNAAVRRFVANDAAPLWRLLTRRFGAAPLDAGTTTAVAQIRASAGSMRIAALARGLGLGPRALQIRFRRHVGLTPKEFARLMRLQATLRALETQAPLSELAADAGFADQAHATRELRRVTGLAPARLRTALLKERGGDTAVRLAAAFVRGAS
jgi:AraC-like DNA-binding protein